MTELTRAYILAVATEEAALACANLDGVLGMAFDGSAKLARRRAMTRILRETACDPRELARQWGCDPCVVYRAQQIGTPPAPREYDPDTARRLQWAHGEGRPAAIIKGVDQKTNVDIATWRRLGQRSAA